MDSILLRLSATAARQSMPRPKKAKKSVAAPAVHPNIHPAAPEVLITPQGPPSLPSIAGNSHPALLSALHLPQ